MHVILKSETKVGRVRLLVPRIPQPLEVLINAHNGIDPNGGKRVEAFQSGARKGKKQLTDYDRLAT